MFSGVKKMKKYLKTICSVLLVTFILAICVGCNNTGASDKAVSIGKKVIEITDSYLDMDISASSAEAQVEELYDTLDEYLEDQDLSSSDTYTKDSLIKTYILCVELDISRDGYYNTEETYDELIEERNELAAAVGAKKRK